MAPQGELTPDGQSIATSLSQVPPWSIVLDDDGRVWEWNGSHAPGANWKFITGSNRGLRYGYHMGGMVALPVMILAQRKS